MEVRVTRARKVFSDGKHNAFTGIAAVRDKVFIAFRSGPDHGSVIEGTIKVLASTDAENWDLMAELRQPAPSDLRDPKVVAFGESLLLFCGERRAMDAQRISLVFRSTDGKTFGEPQAVRGLPEGHWLWHVQAHDGRLYGTAYNPCRGEYAVALYSSADGLDWEWVADFPVPGGETYLDFDREGVLWALVRHDDPGSGDHIPALCVAEPPYAKFRSVRRLPLNLQGPMIKRLEGGCVIVCRQWDAPGRRNLRTDLFWLGDGRDLRRIRSLPSGGDTSYAGWLDQGEGRALLSYYSSHEHKMDEPHSNDAVFAKDRAYAEHSTPADIFVAEISYASAAG